MKSILTVKFPAEGEKCASCRMDYTSRGPEWWHHLDFSRFLSASDIKDGPGILFPITGEKETHLPATKETGPLDVVEDHSFLPVQDKYWDLLSCWCEGPGKFQRLGVITGEASGSWALFLEGGKTF